MDLLAHAQPWIRVGERAMGPSIAAAAYMPNMWSGNQHQQALARALTACLICVLVLLPLMHTRRAQIARKAPKTYACVFNWRMFPFKLQM